MRSFEKRINDKMNRAIEKDSQSVEELRQQWLREQQDVASRVIVLPDGDTDLYVAERFSLVPIANHDENPYFGGVDVSFPKKDEDPSVAVYAIIDSRTMKVVYLDHQYFHLTVPYISTFLAFREIDPLERLVKNQMNQRPELTPAAILVDGNGILHPRGAGIACFLGVRTGIPTIGIAKTLLCEGGLTETVVQQGMDNSLKAAAEYLRSLSSDESKTSSGMLLIDSNAIRPESDQFEASESRSNDQDTNAPFLDRQALGRELAPFCKGLTIQLEARRKSKVDKRRVMASILVGHGGRIGAGKATTNPIFVSVGHNISLRRAVEIAASLSHARIPEPVRQADLIGRRMLREADSLMETKKFVASDSGVVVEETRQEVLRSTVAESTREKSIPLPETKESHTSWASLVANGGGGVSVTPPQSAPIQLPSQAKPKPNQRMALKPVSQPATENAEARSSRICRAGSSDPGYTLGNKSFGSLPTPRSWACVVASNGGSASMASATGTHVGPASKSNPRPKPASAPNAA